MKIGDIEAEVVSGGPMRLDGGGMFGVLPRPLWSKLHAPDDRGRIQLDTNCLLIRTGDELILVDTGNGAKMTEKERAIYDLALGEELLTNLAARSVQPEDVTQVILTHLHMDHAGGGTRWSGEEAVPTFPRARYLVQRGEWDDATANRSHMRTSYRRENMEPLERLGRLELLDGDAEIVPGVAVRVAPGHTPSHQCVILRSGDEAAYYVGDVCPTVAHLRSTYSMAFDMEPYRALQTKAALLAEAVAENAALILAHEPGDRIIRLQSAGDNLIATPV